MVRFGGSRTVTTVAIVTAFFCFAGSAQAEQIKLSDPWKGQEVIETDAYEMAELEHIRGMQRDTHIEKQIREVLLERAAAEPPLLRGED